MAFFRNTAVNMLNAHYGLHQIAIAGGGAFMLAFLLKAGVETPFIFLALVGILTTRFIFRPLVVPLAPYLGLRNLLVLGTFLSAFQYLFIAQVKGLDGWMLAWLIAGGIGDTVYWSSYHAFFAALGDHDHRGSQLGVREAIVALVGIVSPVLAGWALVAFGPNAAFGATTFFLLVSALPLFFTPNIPVAKSAPGAFKAAIPGFKYFLADGGTVAGFYFCWQIVLFQSLHESYIAFGGALAFASLIAAVGGMFLGRLIDHGHGRRAVYLSVGLYIATIIARALSQDHAGLAIAANAIGALVIGLYIPTMMTPVYNLAKRAPCVLRFHVACEGGWDLGGAAGCLLLAFLAWFGVPLWVGILTALAGVTWSAAMLLRYYGEHPDVQILPPDPVLDTQPLP